MTKIRRLERREEPFLVSRPRPETPGVFLVGATWGSIQAMQVVDGGLHDWLTLGLPVASRA